jgi:lysophospholipase L1-like esterase
MTLRFAALGDSLTSGIGDPVGDGWRGWAALLGASFAAYAETQPAGGGPAFRNFAVSGALTRDVEEQQVPAAVDFGADLVSVVVGVNDTLRRAFDIHEITHRLDRVCAALVAQGAVLLTACLPDPGTMLGLPGPLARPLARRQRSLNAVVHALSARYDTVHLHMSDASWVTERTLWSADRLHPGERGHRMIAASFHGLLTERGLARGSAPSLAAERPPPSTREALRWLATKGISWVLRRCRDLLPELLRLAAAELRHWTRGTTEALDLLAEQAVQSALESLPPVSRMCTFAARAAALRDPAAQAAPARIAPGDAGSRRGRVPEPFRVDQAAWPGGRPGRGSGPMRSV